MKPRNWNLTKPKQDSEEEPMPHDQNIENLALRKDLKSVLLLTILGLVVSSIVVFFVFPHFTGSSSFQLTHLFWVAVFAGLVAQIIDGALGMAYGVTSTTLLMALGVPPAAATGSVHMSEVFTTAFSGLSHYKMGNVDFSIFKKLLIPGSIGAVIGAYIVSIKGDVLKPYISLYLVFIGFYILLKAYKRAKVKHEMDSKNIVPLALFGGFIDSVGGGGWGPVVTSTLIVRGGAPRKIIGSVNSAEFFISIAAGVSFAILLGFGYWQVIAGLIFGGLFAAPFAAFLTKRIPTKALLIFVGFLVIIVSSYNLYRSIF